MRWIAGTLIVLQLTGCATTLKKDEEPIVINSRPAGANAAIECAGGVHASTMTPGKVTIPRTADACVLSLSKDGYAKRIVRLERGYNAAYWGNFALVPGITTALFVNGEGGTHFDSVLFGLVGVAGIAGFIVDRVNGRGYRHFPDQIDEPLEPLR